MLFMSAPPPLLVQEGRLEFTHLRPLPPRKHLLPHLQRSVGYLSALVVKLRIGMGVAQLSSSSGGIQMNTIAHAQLRLRAADLHVGGTLLSMAEVSLLGDSVATYLACVTWCLVKVVVETLD